MKYVFKWDILLPCVVKDSVPLSNIHWWICSGSLQYMYMWQCMKYSCWSFLILSTSLVWSRSNWWWWLFRYLHSVIKERQVTFFFCCCCGMGVSGALYPLRSISVHFDPMNYQITQFYWLDNTVKNSTYLFIFCSFSDTFSGSVYVVLNNAVITAQWIGRDVEGAGHGIIRGKVPTSVCQYWGGPLKFSVRSQS
jgi:hypothetical protein